MSKRYIQEARKARLQQLKHLVEEATSFSSLQENKNLPANQKKARYFISEYHRLVGTYSALLMLEFYEKGTKETVGVLKNIQQNNKDNELGVFLQQLRIEHLVGAIDDVTASEGEYKAQVNTGFSGYGSGGFTPTATGNIRESLSEEAMTNELFGFGSKKPAEEPYEPKPSQVRLPGGQVGTYSPAEKTDKGHLADLTKERSRLMAEIEKEMPIIVSFIDAYLAVFKEENKGKLKAGKGFFGASPAASLIKKEFGKVPGFNVAMFVKDIAQNPDLVDTNIAMATNPKNFEALTGLEDAFNKVQARMNKSFGTRVVDMFSSFGTGGRGFKTMYESN